MAKQRDLVMDNLALSRANADLRASCKKLNERIDCYKKKDLSAFRKRTMNLDNRPLRLSSCSANASTQTLISSACIASVGREWKTHGISCCGFHAFLIVTLSFETRGKWKAQTCLSARTCARPLLKLVKANLHSCTKEPGENGVFKGRKLVVKDPRSRRDTSVRYQCHIVKFS